VPIPTVPTAPTAPITESNVLVNATAEEEAAENACSAIGNGDAKKYTPLTFTKKMWADACPWLSAYNQAYVEGYIQGCMQKLGITDETDNTCLKFVQDTMRKTFH
jgi:glycine cleavage system pyridoxal-binding protein P